MCVPRVCPCVYNRSTSHETALDDKHSQTLTFDHLHRDIKGLGFRV
jgi:hypothetical protein